VTGALDVLEPEARAIEYQGERLEIRPLTIGMLPKFVRLARPIIDALVDADLAQLQDGDELDVLLDLVVDHGEASLAAAALVTGKPQAWIESGDLAEFIALATAVFEVNRDFFTRKLAPLLAGRARPSVGTGATPSSASSAPGTH
jgi:hypothetical protein